MKKYIHFFALLTIIQISCGVFSSDYTAELEELLTTLNSVRKVQFSHTDIPMNNYSFHYDEESKAIISFLPVLNSEKINDYSTDQVSTVLIPLESLHPNSASLVVTPKDIELRIVARNNSDGFLKSNILDLTKNMATKGEDIYHFGMTCEHPYCYKSIQKIPKLIQRLIQAYNPQAKKEKKPDFYNLRPTKQQLRNPNMQAISTYEATNFVMPFLSVQEKPTYKNGETYEASVTLFENEIIAKAKAVGMTLEKHIVADIVLDAKGQIVEVMQQNTEFTTSNSSIEKLLFSLDPWHPARQKEKNVACKIRILIDKYKVEEPSN